MKPANSAFRRRENTKVLAITASNPHITHSQAKHIDDYFRDGDILVVNRSGTLPSSFTGIHEKTGSEVEIRLASFQGRNNRDLSRWYAIAFGAGDWQTPTENRKLPPNFQANDIIAIDADLRIVVESADESHNRLLMVVMESNRLVHSLYAAGKPIQYSYLNKAIETWDQQTLFSGPPISVEPPSAAFFLSWEQVLRLKNKGVEIAFILHGAGISSSGSDALDARLPLSEWYEVPASTVKFIQATKEKGGRVIALGTTVARALESATINGALTAGSGFTTLKLGPNSRPVVVDGLISGLHGPGTSHLELSKAFCSQELIERAYQQAADIDYRDHEFGDVSFLSCFG
jgi:S-adenosylmethionine:tRNA ribosyltransferase-isomerase